MTLSDLIERLQRLSTVGSASTALVTIITDNDQEARITDITYAMGVVEIETQETQRRMAWEDRDA